MSIRGHWCPSPRGIIFALSSPDEAFRDGAKYSSWSLRAGMVWWFFGVLLVVIPLGLIMSGYFSWNHQSKEEKEAFNQVANTFLLIIIAGQVGAFGIGAIRAATYEDIRVKDGRVTVKWKTTPWITWKVMSFRLPVPIMLARATAQYGMMGYRDVGVLVYAGTPAASVCIAGFKTECEAHAWLHGIPEAQVRIDPTMHGRMVSTIHFP